MSRQDLSIEQRVLRSLKALTPLPSGLLLAVSGGVDSIVMAEILYKWRRALGLKMSVAHVHHGPSKSRKQAAYRLEAQRFVGAWANARELAFFTNVHGPSEVLHSEQALRHWREGLLKEWRKEGQAVAFAHHQDDLLETRLIRLVRGSGAQGLRSMSLYSGGKLRPLLALSASEVRAYAAFKKLEWIEDPSNGKGRVLRNWMRREWLPLLEERRPGAVRALARSLEILAPEAYAIDFDLDLGAHVGLRREAFSQRNALEQRELLARYLKSLGLKGYAQTHVEEILKRLATRRRNAHFEMLGLRFQISPDFLWASRV